MSIDACASMVREADPDRYAAAMCVKNLSQRADLMCLYAFNIEVARAPWVTQEEMIAEMRLQWWKDAIAEIFDGKTVRKHEVVTPLADLILQRGVELPRALFDDLIEARRFDIYRQSHSDNQELNLYLSATSGNIMSLAARVLYAPDITPFQTFGAISGLANLIVALPELYARGRDPLPIGALDRNALIEGHVPDNLAQFIKDKTRDALDQLGKLDLSKTPRSTHPALFAGWATKGMLQNAHDQANNILRTDFVSTPLKRSATLFWRSIAPVSPIG